MAGSGVGQGYWAPQGPAGSTQRGIDPSQQYAQQGENYRAQLGANVSMLPAQNQQSRFNTVWPWMQGQYSTAMGNMASQMSAYGQSGMPQINTSPIWNSQQIQQRVNQMRSQNDSQTGGQIREMNQNLSGKGFGTNSPLAQALTAQYQGQNQATNTGAENDLRWNAAEGNANHVLDAQKAQADVWSNYQNQLLQRQQQMLGMQGSLLGILGNMA